MGRDDLKCPLIKKSHVSLFLCKNSGSSTAVRNNSLGKPQGNGLKTPQNCKVS